MALRNGILIGIIGFAIGCAATTVLVQGQPMPTGLKGEIAHVGIAVRDIDKSAKTFADIFGVPVPGPARLTKNIPFPDGKRTMAVKSLHLIVNGIDFELLEPASPGPNPWRDYLDRHGEGVQHIAFRNMDGFDNHVKFLTSKGGTWIQGNSTVNFGYIDMTKQLGFTIEILPKGGVRRPPQD